MLSKIIETMLKHSTGSESPKVRKSDEAGCAQAQCNLGRAYDKGSGVVQDYVEAVKRYHESAEAGYGPEQCGHCAMYTKGEGVARGFEQDHAAAFWLQVATVHHPNTTA